MTSEKELMRTDQLYNAGDAELTAWRNRTKQLIFEYNQSAPAAESTRNALLQKLLDNPTKDAYIEAPTRMDYGQNIHLGAHFYANYESIFLDTAQITIGDNVLLGPRVSLLTAGHPIDPTVRNEGLEFGKPITIGNDVWIGGSVTVCPGVTIGSNVVIGAGAVVTQDIPANSVATGVPAKVLRKITTQDQQTWTAEKKRYLANRA
ncbi:sugar O-acetyltransferase [Agrilactobacillus yilanensis]|uniref:Acetyltransferase n=1 Tax=Agrilactobacillus yilanensis TaxID=2485997 RepID=A0ABW4J5Z6_9LACO|nr:sugar O-acetyltransferase [Agrilactobacillus yilanensis]